MIETALTIECTTELTYDEFDVQKVQCRECEIGKHYDTVVLSEGCRNNPVVMIIGESPGCTEIEKKRPFIGLAGQKLRHTIGEFGFRTTNTIISNVIPCRPLDNKFPTDRQLVMACVKRWLAQEIAILKPKFLLLLGNQALTYVLGYKGISSKRGEWYEGNCMPTYHPSYVLRKIREGDEQCGMDFRTDIKEVADKAGFEYGKSSH